MKDRLCAIEIGKLSGRGIAAVVAAVTLLTLADAKAATWDTFPDT